MAAYRLKCQHPDCGAEFADDGFRHRCERDHGPALLRACYPSAKLSVETSLPGIFPYRDWLPTGSVVLDGELGRPCCYRSCGLAARLGLRRLHIAFSGYWPERGANLVTRSFKEFEAQATLARYLSLPEADRAPLLVCSAGNTARGFMLACHAAGVPLCVVVPEAALALLRLPQATRAVVIAVRGDYTDAIGFAEKLARGARLLAEGGARNVARRAGMGAVMLHAVAHPQQGTGCLFDHYFQAIGSGAGAIAAWEAVELLRADGRFGNATTRIHVAQNAPFCPVPDAWERGQRELPPESVTRERVAAVAAPLLTSRQPAYGIAGGLFDILTTSGGSAWRVTNRELSSAMRVFFETEGAPISPAAGVAVDALRQAVACGKVRPDDSVLLHITGGGEEMANAVVVQPALQVAPDEVERAIEFIARSDGPLRQARAPQF